MVRLYETSLGQYIIVNSDKYQHLRGRIIKLDDVLDTEFSIDDNFFYYPTEDKFRNHLLSILKNSWAYLSMQEALFRTPVPSYGKSAVHYVDVCTCSSKALFDGFGYDENCSIHTLRGNND